MVPCASTTATLTFEAGSVLTENAEFNLTWDLGLDEEGEEEEEMDEDEVLDSRSADIP